MARPRAEDAVTGIAAIISAIVAGNVAFVLWAVLRRNR